MITCYINVFYNRYAISEWKKKGAGLNGISLSYISDFFELYKDFWAKLPKLLVSIVFCIYFDHSGTCQFIQLLLPKRRNCFLGTLKETPFVAVPSFSFVVSPWPLPKGLYCPEFSWKSVYRIRATGRHAERIRYTAGSTLRYPAGEQSDKRNRFKSDGRRQTVRCY